MKPSDPLRRFWDAAGSVNPAEVSAAEARLLGPEAAADIPAPTRQAVRDVLLPAQLAASRLAGQHQGRYFRAGQAVWVLFPIAVAAVALGVLFPRLAPVAFGLEFVLMATILVAVVRADRARSLTHWVEHRVLAERLRAATVTVACGAWPAGHDLAVHPSMPDTRNWTDVAYGEIAARLPPMAVRPSPAAVRTLLDRWLDEQQRFHETKAGDAARRGRRLEHAGHAVFGTALAAALAHVVLPLAGVHVTWLEGGLVFGAIALPGVGAALGGFRTHREYSRLARRSRTMAAALAAHRARLALEPDARLDDELRIVERIMLEETRDWHSLMQAASVYVPG